MCVQNVQAASKVTVHGIKPSSPLAGNTAKQLQAQSFLASIVLEPTALEYLA
jgi:hypothetical protein